MKRGEIWTVSGSGGYAGKPRPAVVVQSDSFPHTASLTICSLTTNTAESALLRLPLAPSQNNGLRESSRLMIDKITTIPKSRLGSRIGQLDDIDLVRLNRALVVFLGLAG